MNEHLATDPSAQDAQDAQLRLLSLIERHPDYSQRRLAQALGVSLGKAHYLLTALFELGWVRAEKSSRGAGKARNVYALTPTGVSHRLELSRRSLQMKEQEFISLKSEIEQLRSFLDTDVTRPGRSSDGTSFRT